MRLVQTRLVQMSFGTDEIGTDELWLIQGLVKMRYAGGEVAPLLAHMFKFSPLWGPIGKF